jgi:hypothetical protein
MQLPGRAVPTTAKIPVRLAGSAVADLPACGGRDDFTEIFCCIVIVSSLKIGLVRIFFLDFADLY